MSLKDQNDSESERSDARKSAETGDREIDQVRELILGPARAEQRAALETLQTTLLQRIHALEERLHEQDQRLQLQGQRVQFLAQALALEKTKSKKLAGALKAALHAAGDAVELDDEADALRAATGDAS